MSREAGRARPAWLWSLAIHALLVAVVVTWLHTQLSPAPLAERPQPLQLAMFEPAPPTPPAPSLPAETLAAVQPEPLEPPPVVEPPKPAPVPRPAPAKKPPAPAPSAKPESQPAAASAAIEPVAPAPVSAPVPVEPREPPPAPPAVSPPDPGLEEGYRARVRQAVDEHKHYPRLARRLGVEGRVVVAFIVAADGRLLEVRVVESSGSEVLDEAALEAVRQAAPFPPFPTGIERSQWGFTLPLSFALES